MAGDKQNRALEQNRIKPQQYLISAFSMEA